MLAYCRMLRDCDVVQSLHVSYMFRRSSYLPGSHEQLNASVNEVGMLNVEGSDIVRAEARRNSPARV